jgi:hypothetical protein
MLNVGEKPNPRYSSNSSQHAPVVANPVSLVPDTADSSIELNI